MSTYVEARDAIVTLLNTRFQVDKPDLTVVWDNVASVDIDSVSTPFVRIEIEFDDAKQLTINDVPEHQVYGAVTFTIMTKEGLGTRAILDLMQYLSDVVRYKNLTKCVFETPRPTSRITKSGWVSFDLRAPFFFHTLM